MAGKFEMTGCVHHFILGSPVNDFEASTVTIHHHCKKCGLDEDRTTEALDAGRAEWAVTAAKDVPEGFHLVSDEE